MQEQKESQNMLGSLAKMLQFQTLKIRIIYQHVLCYYQLSDCGDKMIELI